GVYNGSFTRRGIRVSFHFCLFNLQPSHSQPCSLLSLFFNSVSTCIIWANFILFLNFIFFIFCVSASAFGR
ncbi:hypothetical protein VIGAN_06254000, partial [Vigna angularis var. angularis]